MVADVGDTERVSLQHVDLDVPVRIRSTMSSMIPRWRSSVVQVEILDDFLEPSTAEDLLADGVQPILDSRRHRRTDIVFRDLLRDDENHRIRTVFVWKDSAIQGLCRQQ